MPETIGQRLKQARERRLLSLEKVAESTRIRLHHLQALETDDYSLIPSAAQARGFLRNYAAFLGLDLSAALAEMQRARPGPVEEISGPLPKLDLASDVLAAPQPPVETSSGAPARPTLKFIDRLTKYLRSIWTDVLARFQKAPAAPEVHSAPPRQTGLPAEPDALIELEPTRSESELATDDSGWRTDTIITTDDLPDQPESARAEFPAESGAGKDEHPVDETRSSVTLSAAIEETKAEEQSPPEITEPAEASDDSSSPQIAQTLWSRLTPLFRLRFTKNDLPSESRALESEPDSEPEVQSEAELETPEEIYLEIGGQLRKRRDMLSLTLEEIERHIKVRAVFIKALEEGAFEKLPSAVQTRGVLANYAELLNLDIDALLLRYADAIQASHRLRYPEKTAGNKSPLRVSPRMPPLRTFIAADLIFGIGVAALLMAMAVWGVNRVFSAQAAEQASLPTAPSISDVLATSQQPTAIQEVTLIPAEEKALPGEDLLTPTASPESPDFDVTISVQVNIFVVERTFLRVNVDGEEEFNGRALAGATYTYEAAESVEILTGNAAALRITYNGRELGLMGDLGEVANRIYTAQGVITPTPAAPPTWTPSRTPTPTLTPTATPKTPSPTPGG